MRRRFELTPSARQDLRDIVLYVAAQFGTTQGERVRAEFADAFRLLAERPDLGRHRPELWPAPTRFWLLGPSLIAYRGDVTPIQILRIARAARDWDALRR